MLAAGLSEHPRMMNGNVVRAPVACIVSVPVRCRIGAGADSRLLHNVTSRTGSPVIEPEQIDAPMRRQGLE